MATAEVRALDVAARTRAMATDITVMAWGAEPEHLQVAVAAALQVFHDVEAQCTRFDDASPLMRANAAAENWICVPSLCFAAVQAAWSAYERTRGRFDPRVQADLVRLGYGHSFSFADADVHRAGDVARRAGLPSWRPEFHPRKGEVRIGPHPIDLGGIGKGLAVRWASDALRSVTPNYLIEAGGDCYAAGSAPGGGPWQIGIEDPFGGADPLLVLAVRDRAVTTSSIRVRRWQVGDARVHHLIDPRTGLPAQGGLHAVTVVGADAADAEVDAKVAFVDGVEGICGMTGGAAVCWVLDSGVVHTTAALDEFVSWRRP